MIACNQDNDPCNHAIMLKGEWVTIIAQGNQRQLL